MLKTFTFRPSKSQIGRMVLSLALAILLWGWVTQLQDPYETRQFSDIPIQTSGLADGLQIITTLPTATVQISGAQSDLKEFNSSSQITVSLDTNSVKGPGDYRVPVKVDELDGISDRKVEPREVQIQVEQTESKVFPLDVDTTSLPPDDSRKIANVSASVSQVTVTGASSNVARVAQVKLPIKANQQTSTFTAEFTPIAVDEKGQQISEVTLLPATISAEVTIESRGKVVSVVPRIIGVPAEGFSVQQRTSLPDTILVDGPQEELDKLLFVDTEPVDISDASESISRRVGIADLPAGLHIVDPPSGKVEVRVAIEDTTSKATVFSALSVEPIGLSDDLQATIDPATVNVSVNAPRATLQAMTADDVKVRIDLTGLGPGTYTLQPDVTVPQGVTWLGNDPSGVSVVISKKNALAAPQASPAATPEATAGQATVETRASATATPGTGGH